MAPTWFRDDTSIRHYAVALLTCATLGGALRSAPAAAQAAPGTEEALRPAAPGTPQLGVRGTPSLPGTDLLESDTDWSWVDESRRHSGARYWLKNIPIGSDGDIRLSAGVLGRVQFKAYRDQNFGAERGDNGYLGYRANPWASLSFRDRLRGFVQFKTGDDVGDDYFVPPTDRDRIDLHQAFAEVAMGDAFGLRAQDVLVRFGRQELTYGSGLLVSLREGPNLRQSLDGALVRVRIGRRVTDVVAVYGVSDRYGAFDNATDTTQTLTGFYSAGPIGGAMSLDLYALRSRQGTATAYEHRLSLGGRLSSRGPAIGWIWSGEVIGQVGTATAATGRSRIRAWIGEFLLARRLGSSLRDPLVGVRALVSSGDRDPTDARIGTFRGPLSRGPLFQNVNGIGLGNLTETAAYAELPLPRAITLTTYALGAFRTSRQDGIYTVQGTPLRGSGGPSRRIGWQAGATLTRPFGPAVTAFAEAGHFFAGPYLRDNPPAADVTFVRTGVNIQY